MKARLAKKIIKVGYIYNVYRTLCRRKRRKYHSYWTRRWAFRAGWMSDAESMTRKHSRVLYWLKGYDMRLDEALRRQSQYVRKIQDDVEEKQMEKRNRLHKMLERVKARQSGKEGDSNGKADFSISSKMESL
mgnify:CR=1 FL=1